MFEKLKFYKLIYNLSMLFLFISFVLYYCSYCFRKIKFLYSLVPFIPYFVIFDLVVLFISKILISNIKDKILYSSLAELNENVKAIKNKSNDL